MIERQFISQKLKEKHIQDYLKSQLRKTGYSHTEIKRTPLGEKIIVYTTHPGIVVGRKGENIQRLTTTLKKRFKMDNPQIEIAEVEDPMLDVDYVSDRIISVMERLGAQRFKSIGYRTLQNIMDAGAMGAEIIISGKIPSSRARTWRFSAGYLKKSGDISENFVQRSTNYAKLKPGVIGVRVSIMPPDLQLADKIEIKENVEEVKEVKKEKKSVKKTEKKTEEKPKKEEKVEPLKEKETKEKKVVEKETESKEPEEKPKKEEKVETSEEKEKKPKEEILVEEIVNKTIEDESKKIEVKEPETKENAEKKEDGNNKEK